ncbi:MAG: ATP-binding protein [Anaerolineaceae bacterium]
MSELPKIGAFVLETLTTGMYTNPLDSIREFVQNASDSIRNAEENKQIKVGEGRIWINSDPKNKKLTIRDNGTGIEVLEAKARLLNIGMSSKKIDVDAGFRGIGRLAGIAYCKNLSFRTTFIGEDKLSVITIDCDALRNAISPSMRQAGELAEVISDNSVTTYEHSKPEEHFFEVILEGILPNASNFLDNVVLEDYMSQVSPVKLDAQTFRFSKIITEWVKHHNKKYPISTLVIKTPECVREVFKPYKNRFSTSKENYDVRIKDICFFPDSPTPEDGFWIWYGKTDLVGTVGDEKVAGLRFRKNNLLIGGQDDVADLFRKIAPSYARFNSWYIGEIHITDNFVIPNARRDGFEANEAWQRIREKLTPFIKDLCTEAYQASSARNLPVIKIQKSAEKVLRTANEKLASGFVSDEEKQNLLDSLKKEEDKVLRTLETRKETNPVEANEVISPLLERIQAATEEISANENYSGKKLRSDLDKKQRKIIVEILQILYAKLDESQFLTVKKAILTKYQIEEKNGS